MVYDFKFPTLAKTLFYQYCKNRKAGRLPVNCGFRIVNFTDVESVSYTHLDVYKRQPQNRKTMIRRIAFYMVMVFIVPLKVSAGGIPIPNDWPTIEALINLHKAIKKDEDKALQRVTTSFGEQSMLTKGANKFHEVRTTLDTKLSNAHSYLVLAGAVSSTANSLYQLVKEYKDFTGNTFNHVSKKPFVAWYYTCRLYTSWTRLQRNSERWNSIPSVWLPSRNCIRCRWRTSMVLVPKASTTTRLVPVPSTSYRVSRNW